MTNEEMTKRKIHHRGAEDTEEEMKELKMTMWAGFALSVSDGTARVLFMKKFGHAPAWMIRVSDMLLLGPIQEVIDMNYIEIIQLLCNHLPDSEHYDNESWGYAWEELDWESQDAVKAARAAARKFMQDHQVEQEENHGDEQN